MQTEAPLVAQCTAGISEGGEESGDQEKGIGTQFTAFFCYPFIRGGNGFTFHSGITRSRQW